MRSSVVCVAVVLGVSCVSAQPVLAPPSGDDVTIFVHGYKGALLKTAAGELAWLTPGQALSVGDKSLALPFEGQRESPRYGPLTVVGPVTKLTIVPLIVEETLYLPVMEWGRDSLPGFMVFAYDWRQDIRTSADALCARIESLGPHRRVRIIAHSMGGLVTLHCLRHGPQTVRQMVTHVVFAGTPFKGSSGAFDDLFLGNTTVKNSTLMSAQALLTFPSTWQLLPPEPDFFVDEAHAPARVEAFSSQAWLDHRWGVFKDPSLAADAAYRGQLEARLEAHRAFWAGMGDDEGGQSTFKTMIIVGKGRPTTEDWVVGADGSFDFSKSVNADGDGAVVRMRAMPPKPIAGAVVETTAEHAVMLNDPGVQAAIADFVKR